MTPSVFDGLRELAHEHAGIAMRPGKEALVTARLAPRLRALGLADERAYLAHVRGAFRDEGNTSPEVTAFLDALATNVTSFFREPEHFEVLAEHVTGLLAQGSRRLRVWSAACSTGQEPLTIAMVLEDLLASSGIDWRVLATDLSTTALARARRCRYTFDEVSAIPAELRERHLTHAEDGWRPGAHLAGRINVERLNLARTPYPLNGPIDVVFCRNVFIYLSRPTKQRLVREIERVLRPGGLFMIGHSETLHGLETSLRAVQPSVYVK